MVNYPFGATRHGRRVMLRHAAALLASAGLQTDTNTDALLLEACGQAINLERQKRALFTGLSRVTEDDGRDMLLDKLDALQRPYLEQLAGTRAHTIAVQSMRAGVVAMMDGGELQHLAAVGDVRAQLLRRMIIDLGNHLN